MSKNYTPPVPTDENDFEKAKGKFLNQAFQAMLEVVDKGGERLYGREFSENTTLYEVKSGNTTLEMTPLPSKVEKIIRTAKGYLTVFAHNLPRGSKQVLVVKQAAFGFKDSNKADEAAAQAVTNFHAERKKLKEAHYAI